MDNEQFRQAINNGLGRAVLWLREQPWQPHAEAIEHVCLHNTAYDPQCEGSRADYVHEVVGLTDAPERFADLVAKCLLGTQDVYWDTVHLFHVNRLFAQGGYAPARAALYEKFERNDAEEPFVGGDQIVALDGVQGLLFVLDWIGRYLPSHPDDWLDDGLLREAEDELGVEPVSSAVREAAAANPNVRRFVEAVELYHQNGRGRQSLDYRGLTWPQLRENIGAGDVPRGWLFGWGRRASAEALRAAASDLLNETDHRRVLANLRIFDMRPFPLCSRRLIELAASIDEETRRASLRALRHLRDDAVRAFAVERLSQADAGGDEVRLLVRNYADGNHRLIESLLDRRSDEDGFHWTAHAAVEVFEQNEQADALPSMLNVYERCRCSLCRSGAVGVLIRRRQAPAWMLAECRYDSNPDIRERVGVPPAGGQA